jgi:hypothetical protein
MALKLSDDMTIEMFNHLKHDSYPFNHSKFESLQYLDSIVSTQELKFRKIKETIETFKKEAEEEKIRKEEEAKQKKNFGFGGFRNH